MKRKNCKVELLSGKSSDKTLFWHLGPAVFAEVAKHIQPPSSVCFLYIFLVFMFLTKFRTTLKCPVNFKNNSICNSHYED